MRVVQAFAPLLKASSNPQLVNITASASSMGNYPNVPIQPYAASKATLNFLLVALAAEEPWLKVQHIHPGVVMVRFVSNKGMFLKIKLRFDADCCPLVLTFVFHTD